MFLLDVFEMPKANVSQSNLDLAYFLVPRCGSMTSLDDPSRQLGNYSFQSGEYELLPAASPSSKPTNLLHPSLYLRRRFSHRTLLSPPHTTRVTDLDKSHPTLLKSLDGNNLGRTSRDPGPSFGEITQQHGTKATASMA